MWLLQISMIDRYDMQKHRLNFIDRAYNESILLFHVKLFVFFYTTAF